MTKAAVAIEDTKTRLPGMGCMPHDKGVAFRVWAPHAQRVSVVGSFNNWDEAANPMAAEDHGKWYLDIPAAKIDDEYRYIIINGDKKLSRIDPYARDVTTSIGNGVVHDPNFDWGDDHLDMHNFNELVVYEMHVGTFNRSRDDVPGTFSAVTRRFDYLRRLGVNCIQLMPLAEFAGDISWGYNPAHIYAVESAYGGPIALKHLVKEAHKHGLAVTLDVVYNHFGPSDLDLWQFDGWSENDKGGIYFYNDGRAETPWGATRPDYGRGEVRSFIFDNVMMWLEDYHMDGLRYDMTLFIRSVDGTDQRPLPEGWSLTQWLNREIRQRYPEKIIVAEDLQNNAWLTKPVDFGGAGFSSQWDAAFVHPVRQVVREIDDAHRSMAAVKNALQHRYNTDVFERVVYSESHDEVANGKSRVPSEVDPADPTGWYAQKRSTLAAALVFTAPGIPMIFQGQEFLRGGWFDDSQGIDWDQEKDCHGILRLYRDLIHLRRNLRGYSRGFTGQHLDVQHCDELNKVIAFRRWADGGPGDDVTVIANFGNRAWDDYRIGFVRQGTWRLRFNSDARYYSEDFGDFPSGDVSPEAKTHDGLPFSAAVKLAPYSVLIYSENKPVETANSDPKR